MRERIKLAAEQGLAVLCRALAREGFSDGIGGHVAFRQNDETILVNPPGLTWEELRPGDFLRIDPRGRLVHSAELVRGFGLLLEVLNFRPDVAVVVHNHPRFATAFSSARRMPAAYDLWSCIALSSETQILLDSDGERTEMQDARDLGFANFGLLPNHGVVVLGDSVPLAFQRCQALEQRCQRAWYAETIKAGPPIPPSSENEIGKRLTAACEVAWQAAIRKEVRTDPDLLATTS